MAADPKPLYSVYRAGDRPMVCYRGVSSNPAQPSDFLSFADSGANFEWWDLHRAIGLSAWNRPEKAVALARRKALPWVVELDLSRAHEKTPWAATGRSGHITIWAPGLALIPSAIS